MKANAIRGNAVRLPLTDASVDLIVTSPPYFALRSYRDGDEHYDGQVGSEPTPQAFLEALWACTDEWWRVLKPTGSLWVNLGDKYAGSGGHNNAGISRHGTGKSTLQSNGKPDVARREALLAAVRSEHKATRRQAPDRYNQESGGARPKSLMGLPWRYALGCIDRGWILRRDLVWSKPNGLPESVTDRCRSSHEYWFHLTKQGTYFAAMDELREEQQSLGKGRPWSTDVEGTVPTWGIDGTQGLAGKRTTDQMNALNPLGKLPGSVWTIKEDEWARFFNGPIAFCPKCGRDLRAGSGRDNETATATASNGSATLDNGARIDSSTRSSSDPYRAASPSTTYAGTPDASAPTTSSPSPSASTSFEETTSLHATPPKSTATTGTSSLSPTPTSEKTDDESAGCVCGTARGSSVPGSVWQIPSEPLIIPEAVQAHYNLPDHFAAFPQEWPRRLILGWSPGGVCTACGEGRRPVVEKELVGGTPFAGRDYRRLANGPTGGPERPLPGGSNEVIITGYACACPDASAPTKRAVVLDPFMGTGTVLGVAEALGRTGIGTDLSMDYARLAKWRVEKSGHFTKTNTRTWRERQGVLDFGEPA